MTRAVKFEAHIHECDQCFRQDATCVLFEGGNGEVSGYANVCRHCLQAALDACAVLPKDPK